MVQWLGFLAFTEAVGVRFPVSERLCGPMDKALDYESRDSRISEQRNSPIQKVSDQALRLIAGFGKNTALNEIRAEYGINTINSKTSCLREYAYIKWPTLSTCIVDLTKNPIKSGASTWVIGTTRWLNKYKKKVKSGNTKNTISDRYDKNDKSKIYTKNVCKYVSALPL
ncbi:hypothetical protein BB561_000146 [Smittium simulii]|uniref:Uncharacterized protein n=1 Tax=Smittium simulii TaxID=133385 RepID=A0A2T9Z0A1_9FUNG|nr:hypothetical protein BB561_000146 [Smittium simulii]